MSHVNGDALRAVVTLDHPSSRGTRASNDRSPIRAKTTSAFSSAQASTRRCTIDGTHRRSASRARTRASSASTASAFRCRSRCSPEPNAVRQGISPAPCGVSPSVSSTWRTFANLSSYPVPEAKSRTRSRRNGTSRFRGGEALTGAAPRRGWWSAPRRARRAARRRRRAPLPRARRGRAPPARRPGW